MNLKEETRNIHPFYTYWTNEAIKVHLDERRHPFAVLCANINGDYNKATCLRANNAFLGREFFIYGRRKYDKRGTVGTHHYEHVRHLPRGYDLTTLPYTLVGIDNVDGAEPIDNFVWPPNPLMCFGEEGDGLPSEVLDVCAHKVYIRQYGSVRSLNVGVAAGIAMYDWCVKNAG